MRTARAVVWQRETYHTDTLADIIQTALMLRVNKRNVG